MHVHEKVDGHTQKKRKKWTDACPWKKMDGHKTQKKKRKKKKKKE